MLAEEAGEVVQAAMKVLRHGYYSINPNEPLDGHNRRKLGLEVGNLLFLVSQMEGLCDLATEDTRRGIELKQINWGIYTHHQGEAV